MDSDAGQKLMSLTTEHVNISVHIHCEGLQGKHQVTEEQKR